MKANFFLKTFIIACIIMFTGCVNDDFEETEGVCPIVLSTAPTNGSINVSLDQTITATFNEDMDPATFTEESFILQGNTQVAGTVSFSGRVATFNPTSDLAPNTTYTAIIKTTVKDLTGNALQSDYVWSFSTGAVVRPTVISTNPLNNATNVVLNKTVTATFNMAMNTTTINASSFTLKRGTVAVAGVVSYLGTTASFNPTADLLPNTTYTATITTVAKNTAGVALATDYVWAFTTGTTVAPIVVSTDPSNNATNVVLNKTITAKFNMGMNAATINTTSFTLKQGTTGITGIVSYTGTTASFNPSANLLPNTVYTATITVVAKNPAGVALANDYVWTFTTGIALAPLVTSTDPINNATGVVLNKTVTATFNMAMNPSTINTSSFTLKQGTTSVAGTVSYLGNTASFNPNSNLSANTTYTATITTVAESVAGNSLASNYIWNFTTSTVATAGVNLGSAARFGVLAGTGVSNNAGFSEIRNMDVGISPGVRSSITGFPPAIIVNGAIYASDDTTPPGTPAMLIQAKQDLTNAYLFAEGASSPAPATVSGDLGGLTLTPGIYKTTSTLMIQSGSLTLDAQGDVNAVWIFQVASDFTTIGGAGGNVILSGGAQAKNVFWQVGSSATIGDYTSFQGNILALTSITMNSHATAVGRMLARNGAVVMTHTNIITKP
ncbi:MAG: Ig-like domain-containing protein [Bacteroidota bacterium]